jgi:protein-disulfide isomerase
MTTPFTITTGRLVAPVTDEDHVLGPATAPVTLVEYGDYQCPYCAIAHPIVQELLRERPDPVRYVYRHFPLTNVHPYAEVAAETAEDAGRHRRFWRMHDWLFTHQDQLDPVRLVAGLDEVGLPVDEVVRNVNDHVHSDRIRRDFVSGARSGVNGTPTFFVNGVRHGAGYSLPELLAAVDGATSATDGKATGDRATNDRATGH